MRRIRWIIALAAALAVCLGASAFAAAGEKTTTVLVYMCGTDLQDAACEDIFEMSDVEAGEAVNMVVLAGGAEEWDLEDLEGGTRTLFTIRDGYYESEPEDWGRKSMGSAESLEEFLYYGMTEYPADRTIAILWDHGAGSEGGVCFDETADDDGLTVAEINKTLGKLQKRLPDFRIDIFGCDACMMATYEMAAVLSHYNIGYYVASEELEPGTGWDYTGWLDVLADDPSISDEDLCAAIIETFMDAGLAEVPDDYLTLSAVKLSEMPALESSMEKFATVMSGQISSGNISAIRRGRSRLYTFGSFDDGSWDMVDLGAALDAYAQFDPGQAAEAKRCLGRAVLASMQTDNLDTCSGLSILIPQDTTGDFDEYREGINLPDVIPNWIGFVNSYVAGLTGGSCHFTATDAGVITGDTELSDNFTPFDFFAGWFSWDDESGSYTEEETEETGIEITDGQQGFTATLPREELQYLDYVEGMLLMDISDGDFEGYIDFGTMRNNLVDWQSGRVVSLYDGTWPVFGGQMVAMYDQTSNGNSRRSLIPVKLNGEYTYLVVVFPAGSTEGRVAGANAGYDENGLPIRNMTRLNPGDQIIPIYDVYYDNGGDDLEDEEYEGEPITWQDGMTVTYEDLSDEDDPTVMLFAFVFYDIFGNDTMSEMIEFEI